MLNFESGGRLAGAVLCLAMLPSWAGQLKPAPYAATIPDPPQVLFPGLFGAVQTAQLFSDSKTFADAVPKATPQEVMARYRAERPSSPEALRAFVLANFSMPEEAKMPAAATERTRVSLTAHIDGLWEQLTRSSRTPPPFSSLLSLPGTYVVPGGRFREMYYWDSYFTMLGLVESGRSDLVASMVQDFGVLIDTYGHVPNGTRTYYLSRSQPPFFYAMVGLLNENDPAASYVRYLRQLRREYAFWMDGEKELQPGGAHRRVVAMLDGAVLNRYWDDSDTPRDESYREGTELARTSGRTAGDLYREIRAAAESGWDFSTRWFADGQTLATIDTTQIIPVDLNSLLYGLEMAIGAGCTRSGDVHCAREFSHRAQARRAAVNRYLWDARSRVYRDLRWTSDAQVPRISAAILYPLFVGMADTSQAKSVAAAVSNELLQQGGLVTTPLVSGQQWDAPNGWAPLQWIGIEGLRRYSVMPLAQLIACRWLVNIKRVYQESGKLEEKYDVMAVGRPGGGGEYPTQDGFGWTNGVTQKLMALYPAGETSSECK